MSALRFIYVASPYTQGDVALNVRRNLEAADAIAAAGLIPFASLLSHFWHLLHPHPYEFWIAQDMAWLERCDAIVRLPGESAGADAEVAWMVERGKPVFYSIAELLEAA